MNRERIARIVLAAAVAWAAVRIHAAGVTEWPFGRAVLLPAGWATAAGVLIGGTFTAYFLFTAICGRRWRRRT
jgi:hypothetical protein